MVSFSLAWLCISFAVCLHCSIWVGLLASSEVMLALERPMFSVGGAASQVVSISLPLPFSFLLLFIFRGWS